MNPESPQPSRMREELLGYLLGALDSSERDQLEARLEADPQLRAELDKLRAMTEGLDDAPVEPPGDLSHRTVRYVMDRRGPTSGQFAADSHWRLQDLIVGACILVTLSMLVFPAIFSSRCESQLRVCQSNLMTIGKGLLGYSQAHDGEFPAVPTRGPRAAAGIYAPTLVSAGLITGSEVRCPSVTITIDGEFRVPTLTELEAAHGEMLSRMQALMGGTYGYSLGYVVDGRYYPLRNRGRSTFALVADLPSEAGAPAHHGSYSGQNVLFEDGHVQLIRGCRLIDGGDHIYQNDLGLVGAGIGPDDAVICPSATPPIIILRATSK